MRFLAVLFSATLGLVTQAGARDLDAKFLIERKGEVIGYHSVDVTRTEHGARVDTEIEMKVGLGPVTLFRYEHKATEIWRDGELISIVSTTNNNGDEEFVDAKRYGEALMIRGSEYEGPAPANAAPSSYWNKADTLGAQALISTQSGEIINIAVHDKGVTRSPHNDSAEHYFLTGTVGLNLWYEGDRWVGSHFIIDGEELTYRLVDGPQEHAALEQWAP